MPDANAQDPVVAARRVRVAVASRPYDVTIGRGVLRSIGESVRAAIGASADRVGLICDTGIPSTITSNAGVALSRAGFNVARIDVEAGEESKSMQRLASVLECLAAHRLERGHAVVALGGGMVGDLAGFAAAVYRRGVTLVQCPTTMLAMVDASVGGKTGVNVTIATHPKPTLLKNAVGAFHQPGVVLADLACLDSLPVERYREGLAECVKHAMLSAGWGDAGLLEWTEKSADAIVRRGDATMIELIARNVTVKARVVEADEREVKEGGRAVLNLGHTFGHAIEGMDVEVPGEFCGSYGWLRRILTHGEAVSLGLVAAASAAVALRLCGIDHVERTRRLLERFGLPTRARGLGSNDTLIGRMAHDKKVQGGRLRLVVPVGDGRVRVVADPPREVVEAGWRGIAE